MSTRSGKRIHSSLHENMVKSDVETIPRSQRKTRSKRFKENDDHVEITPPKSKKPKNYVSYPAVNIQDEETITSDVTECRTTRKTKRYTLKERDENVPETKNVDSNIESKKGFRLMRQTRKSENTDEVPQNTEGASTSQENTVNGKKKGKKNKKKKSKNSDINENVCEPVNNGEMETKTGSKQSKKKKKGKHPKISTENVETNVLNKSNISTDSFHSASGSPMKPDKPHVVVEDPEVHTITRSRHLDSTLDKDSEMMENDEKRKVIKKAKKLNTTIEKNESSNISIINTAQGPEVVKIIPESYKLDATFEKNESLNRTLEKETKKKRNSSINKNTSKIGNIDRSASRDAITVNDEVNDGNSEKNNSNFEKEIKTRRSLRSNNTTIENETVMSVTLDTTYEKAPKEESKTVSLNSTFEKSNLKRSLRSNNTTIENETVMSVTLNTTYEKAPKEESKTTASLNSTFDKSNPKLNATFDKTESKATSAKSSLISSDDGSISVTCDKTDQKASSRKSSLISSDVSNLSYDKKNSSRISISSDESKDDIVNTTPLLVESSIEEFPTSISRTSNNFDVSKEKGCKEVASTPMATLQLPVAPLTREGTFTKEAPDVDVTQVTPTKRVSLDSLTSPGRTPFHTSRSSQKGRSILNVTRSLEKPSQKFLVENVTRQTKVMFCSPTNNPAVVMQQKRKIIKSSMKGSNKSFVFDESASTSSKPRRKRSFTTSDADDGRGKRKRLADELQQSVDRLSRPRTSSVSAKLPDTPSKKAPTPSKSKSEVKRTKLPNFAALHQKEFSKMESLDECQERKARRARQLLTPTGGVGVLERSSPKAATEPAKQKKSSKKPETVTPKLPTLESLRPGYTRFGFKMNLDVNPFIITSKNEKIPEKQNGVTKYAPKAPMVPTKEIPLPLTRQPTLPSLNGATSRREAAKQTVMREKSFTSLSAKRDMKRNESRTFIKGVRTNRRFELQMKMRNID